MKSAKVLVVDDERLNIEILQRTLGSRGHLVTGADSAEAAEAALAAAPCDLVLLDHVLPGATGMQSIGKLRALTRAPIYVMSGYSDDDTREDSLLLGATGFLPKPLDTEAILALIEAIVETS